MRGMLLRAATPHSTAPSAERRLIPVRHQPLRRHPPCQPPKQRKSAKRTLRQASPDATRPRPGRIAPGMRPLPSRMRSRSSHAAATPPSIFPTLVGELRRPADTTSTLRAFAVQRRAADGCVICGAADCHRELDADLTTLLDAASDVLALRAMACGELRRCRPVGRGVGWTQHAGQKDVRPSQPTDRSEDQVDESQGHEPEIMPDLFR